MTYIRVLMLTALFAGSWSRADGAVATWDPNPDPVLGYILAYGTQPGVHTVQIDVGNVVTYQFFPPPGQRYYVLVWAYNAAGHGSKSAEVLLDLTGVPTNQPPTLVQPANQSSVRGQSASLTLVGSDPEGAALTYSASGLPPGLSVNASTGLISGAPNTSGTYSVAARVSDGSLTATRTFAWSVSEPPPPPDTTPPAVTMASPQSNSTVSGKKVKLTAIASDANGVTGVRFLLNGVPIGVEDTVAPYALTWNSTTVPNGTYQLIAIARDPSNNVGSSAPVPILVRNGRRNETATAAEALSVEEAADRMTAVRGDFDGDRLPDPAVFIDATGEWRLWLSSESFRRSSPIMWGVEGDLPVPADFDGDERTDLAVYTPSTGTWQMLLSTTGYRTAMQIQWGDASDRPVAMDYDNDGRADLVLARDAGLEILLSRSNYTRSLTVAK